MRRYPSDRYARLVPALERRVARREAAVAAIPDGLAGYGARRLAAQARLRLKYARIRAGELVMI